MEFVVSFKSFRGLISVEATYCRARPLLKDPRKLYPAVDDLCVYDPIVKIGSPNYLNFYLFGFSMRPGWNSLMATHYMLLLILLKISCSISSIT